MMRPDDDLPEVYLCKLPVDFRKGVQGLAVLVESELTLDPFSERLFVFRKWRRDVVEILYWERLRFFLSGGGKPFSSFHTPYRRQSSETGGTS